MDRTQAFVEYAHILEDAADSLSGGFRRKRPAPEVLPPPPGGAAVPTVSRADGDINPFTGRTVESRPDSRDAVSPAGMENAEPRAKAEPLTASPTDPVHSDKAEEPSKTGNAPGTSGTSLSGSSSAEEPGEQPVARQDVVRSQSEDGSAGLAAKTDGEGTRPAGPDRTQEANLPDAPQSSSALSGELGTIADEVAVCRKCNLYLLREHTVPGLGAAGATLMIVTPPPTDTADEASSPLAAYEHEYMNRWLVALGLDPRTDIFITPAVKCRTPGARPPQADEAESCRGYLRRQYKSVSPRAVLALGEAACGELTGNPADFPSLVGRDWMWGSVPALVLWTPAEVLANPGRLRGLVWDALQRLKAAWNAVSGTEF